MASHSACTPHGPWSMAHPTSTLPPEVWSHILKNVPRIHQPALLCVSSFFHDILIGFIFSAVKIYFIGGHRGCEMLNTVDDSWMKEIAIKLGHRSWDIMHHICQNTRFARVVKSMTVIAYDEGLALFEQLNLGNTLLALPNLQTFRWVGLGPKFGSIVAKNLPSNLTNLSMTSAVPLNYLQHLVQLQSLQLPTPFFFPDDEESHDYYVCDPHLVDVARVLNADKVLDRLAVRSRSLGIVASQIPNVPIRLYNQLTELDICAIYGDIEELVGLDLVFHHANALESLSLVGLFSFDIFSFFPSSSSGLLSRLTSFRLSCHVETCPLTAADLFVLSEFLRGRTNLRRVFLRLPSMELSQSLQLLECVGNLQGVQVLGFHFGNGGIADEDLQNITKNLSPNIRALHLAFGWVGQSLLPLVDRIGQLPHLSFLHLYSTFGRLPILVQDLALEGKGLDTIGLNRALWDIIRVGPDTDTVKWPRWKIKFCTDEDFLCTDDAWLFKYN